MQTSNITLPIILTNDENNTIIAECPFFKGCHTFWENDKELKFNLEEVVSMYFDMAKSWESVFSWDKILFLNFDQHGKITSDFSKEINQDFRVKLS